MESDPAAAGWTVNPPLPAPPQAIAGSGMGQTFRPVSMVLLVVITMLGGVNYFTTIINLRTRGMHEPD